MPHADVTSQKLYQQIKYHRRNDKAEGRQCDLKVEDVIKQFALQDGKCAISGVSMTLPDKGRCIFDASIDRIDNSIGHVKGNIQLVCQGINFARNSYSIPEVKALLTAVVNVHNA